MISDASKLGLVGVAAVLGILVGLRVSNNLETLKNMQPHIDAIATEQRLLQEEEAASQSKAGSGSDVADIGVEPPYWQRVIEKVVLRARHCTCLKTCSSRRHAT